MKEKLAVLLLVMTAAVGVYYLGASTKEAQATWDPPTFYTGAMFGSTFQNSTDLDGDGSNGRSGVLEIRDSKFRQFAVNVDTTLRDFDPNADPNTTTVNPFLGCDFGDISLRATGEGTLYSYSGEDTLVVRFDEDHWWCLSSEGVVPIIGNIDGENSLGKFHDKSGTVEFYLPADKVLRENPGYIPGYEAQLGVLPFPSHVIVYDAAFVVFED